MKVRILLAWILNPTCNYTSLIKYESWQNMYSRKSVNNKAATFTYTFVSLISPFHISNIRLFFQNLTFFKKSSTKKLWLKQSYLILTWFYYFSSINNSRIDKSQNLGIPNFFVKPRSTNKFTMLKAPIAHKTFSQEQFLFSYYTFIITFKFNILNRENTPFLNINSSLLFLLMLNNNLISIETNLLFLQKIQFRIPGVSDINYLTLY